jgi:hypothetical protein
MFIGDGHISGFITAKAARFLDVFFSPPARSLKEGVVHMIRVRFDLSSLTRIAAA